MIDVRNTFPRNMHVCYALSMQSDTVYADLVSISALCVRSIYPACRITVLTDDESINNFGPTLRSLADIGFEVMSVGKFHGDARLRSRFVKTQVRNVIEGDFLYLDADTVAVSKFAELLECEAPLSAAVDRNRANPLGGFPAWVVPNFDRLGWRHPTEVYLNAGVVFWKDNSKARALGKLWHENWLRYVATFNNPSDQPAFNHSISALGIEPKIMDDAFNARIGVSPEFASGGRIYHFYFDGNEKPEGTIIDKLLAGYRRDGQVDFTLIADAVKRDHPWIGESEKRETAISNRLLLLRDLDDFGLRSHQIWHDDPQGFAGILARYRFISKMLSGRQSVAQFGCSDGFGPRIVHEVTGNVTVYDRDPGAIASFRRWHSTEWPIEASVHDIIAGRLPRNHDAIYSLDAIQFVPPESEVAFVDHLRDSLSGDHDVMIVGTPTSEGIRDSNSHHAASVGSLMLADGGTDPVTAEDLHTSLRRNPTRPSVGGPTLKFHGRTGASLKVAMERRFHSVFLFSMIDETVLAGSVADANYFLALCCDRKQ